MWAITDDQAELHKLPQRNADGRRLCRRRLSMQTVRNDPDRPIPRQDEQFVEREEETDVGESALQQIARRPGRHSEFRVGSTRQCRRQQRAFIRPIAKEAGPK